ncbi:MAG: hypothetical protein IJD12_03350 [Tidjanibacter sp.]|nr:hypothetical protein [Tidjanibacter sp.]
MKRVFFVVLAMMLSTTTLLHAQEKEVWSSFDLRTILLQGEVSYTHGHKVNNHLFLGLGAGMGYYPVDVQAEKVDNTTTYHFSLGGPYIPVYVDAKYRLFDFFLSPAFRIKAGGVFNLANIGAGAFATAEFSIDLFKTFSLNFGYSAQAIYSVQKKTTITNNWPTIGIGIEF